MALVALVIGTSVTAAATERVTISLVLTSALAWAFVPIMQLGTGIWLVRTAGVSRSVPVLERYFDTHRPWSLFLLAAHAVLLAWPASHAFALLFLPLAGIPIGLTVLSLNALCREQLGMPAAAARRAVWIHQAFTYLVVIAYGAWAGAYLPRLVGLFS